MNEWQKLRSAKGGMNVCFWFNHRRLLEPIGNMPPAGAKEQYYAAADIIDMAV
ncbi:hypothetical protein LK533_08105 [Sphingomonas sp. PL-96]|uniref:hypothetical protein n=1 Tax=Sphingomonas sp. PL-96 TaxID=2887201 RepID=UPI001E30AC7C|nr:hypothetical protein [Sphingomonas sp. PL-96]MCC2976637.1 hypothetical protein [Sphingomonas sp. PL-96]